MPQASASAASSLMDAALSPAEMVLQMVSDLLDPDMDVNERLDQLKELSMERISFDTPEQAVKIIATLADMIMKDPSPEIRAAALQVMERMAALEEKAEAEQGKPPIDWNAVHKLMSKAEKRAELDVVPVASRNGAPAPEAPSPQMARAVDTMPSAKPQIAPVEQTPEEKVEDAALLDAQERAVSQVQQAKIPAVPPAAELLAGSPPSASSKPKTPDEAKADFAMPDTGPPPRAIDATVAPGPAPAATGIPPGTANVPKHLETAPVANAAPRPASAPEEKSEPPIMKFLRSVADTDDEQNIRELAHRVIKKIENITANPVPGPTSAPTMDKA